MPRTNQDGKGLKLVLEWLCRRHIPDAELAATLGLSLTSYGRRRDADDFPTYEELERFAATFGLCKRALQISFGLRDRDELGLLDEDGMHQYIEQGGGEAPFFSARGMATAVEPKCEQRVSPRKARRRRRVDAPPGP